MTTGVLFVDDNENILQGLRRNMRSAKGWEVKFALGGEEALKAIATGTVDVIVSDIRMPKTDGAELLTEVKKQFPGTIRLVLSGQCEEDVTLKLLEVSHQYMAKPCPPEIITATINPILQLRGQLRSPTLAAFITGLTALPTLPDIYDAFTKELNSPNPNKKTMEELAARDISMIAKLLQIMNSSYFGPSRDIVSLTHMWELLSLDKIKVMMSQDHLASVFPKDCVNAAPLLENLWKFSHYTAQIARLIAKSEKMPDKIADKCYVAGMLQAIGAVAMYEHRQFIGKMPLREKDLLAATSNDFDTYAAAGGYLLCLWGLQMPIVHAVTHHLAPSSAPVEADRNLLGILHVASALAKSKVWPELTADTKIDIEFLKMTGAFAKLQEWQNIARSV